MQSNKITNKIHPKHIILHRVILYHITPHHTTQQHTAHHTTHLQFVLYG
jgi:hypothetical protein